MSETIDSIDHTIEMLSGTAEGDYAADVWRSPQYPGADMVIKYRVPDTDIDPDGHGVPASFAKAVELKYDGILSREEAIRKLENIRVVAREVESLP